LSGILTVEKLACVGLVQVTYHWQQSISKENSLKFVNCHKWYSLLLIIFTKSESLLTLSWSPSSKSWTSVLEHKSGILVCHTGVFTHFLFSFFKTMCTNITKVNSILIMHEHRACGICPNSSHHSANLICDILPCQCPQETCQVLVCKLSWDQDQEPVLSAEGMNHCPPEQIHLNEDIPEQYWCAS